MGRRKKDEVTAFPVQGLQFSLHIQHLAETTESRATVEVAVHVNALSWAHQMAKLQPFSSSPYVHTVGPYE